MLGTKDFDFSIIFKDSCRTPTVSGAGSLPPRDVQRISAIPQANLEVLIEWFTEIGITYVPSCWLCSVCLVEGNVFCLAVCFILLVVLFFCVVALFTLSLTSPRHIAPTTPRSLSPSFTAGNVNMNWKPLMKIVRNEIKDGVFWEDNEAGIGWKFLGQEVESEGEDEEEESDGASLPLLRSSPPARFVSFARLSPPPLLPSLTLLLLTPLLPRADRRYHPTRRVRAGGERPG